jgi:peptidoglycan/LPS O-acetylase OafA/YrhL
MKKSAQALLLPLIVVSTVLQPNTWMGRILELQPLAWVGRISYSLYLWQQAFASPHLSLTSMPVRIAGLFAVAAASYYIIERPMIKVGRRILAKRKSATSHERAAGSPQHVRAAATDGD